MGVTAKYHVVMILFMMTLAAYNAAPAVKETDELSLAEEKIDANGKESTGENVNTATSLRYLFLYM